MRLSSHVHRELPGSYESTHLSRDHPSRVTGRIPRGVRLRHGADGGASLQDAPLAWGRPRLLGPLVLLVLLLLFALILFINYDDTSYYLTMGQGRMRVPLRDNEKMGEREGRGERAREIRCRCG